jgi:DNA-binding NarL/FixJ family response regulator
VGDAALVPLGAAALNCPCQTEDVVVISRWWSGRTGVEEIAHRASISPGTVRNYLSSAASKLGAANRHEAVHVARTHGWI